MPKITSARAAIDTLYRDDKSALRSLRPDGVYHRSLSALMVHCQSVGMFSRLEECGDTGVATITPFGEKVLAQLGSPYFSDSDGSPEGRDREDGLDGEAATARPEGIAHNE